MPLYLMQPSSAYTSSEAQNSIPFLEEAYHEGLRRGQAEIRLSWDRSKNSKTKKRTVE